MGGSGWVWSIDNDGVAKSDMDEREKGDKELWTSYKHDIQRLEMLFLSNCKYVLIEL